MAACVATEPGACPVMQAEKTGLTELHSKAMGESVPHQEADPPTGGSALSVVSSDATVKGPERPVGGAAKEETVKKKNSEEGKWLNLRFCYISM